jgi:hypothetical protein
MNAGHEEGNSAGPTPCPNATALHDKALGLRIQACAGLLLLLILVGSCLWPVVAVVLFWPVVNSVEATFEELPPTDEALKEWLREQAEPHIATVGREGNTVQLVWGSGGSVRGPVKPDPRPVFEALGYRGLKSYREEKSYRNK